MTPDPVTINKANTKCCRFTTEANNCIIAYSVVGVGVTTQEQYYYTILINSSHRFIVSGLYQDRLVLIFGSIVSRHSAYHYYILSKLKGHPNIKTLE